MEFLFLVVAILIGYFYIGYYIFLWTLSLFVKRDAFSAKKKYYPFISIIIPAYNEEKNISQKIENCLSINYHSDRMEIIIVSDASTDKTDDIVRSFIKKTNNKRIRLLRRAKREGKESAQKLGIENAEGNIIIFSDAATLIETDSVLNIVKNFCNPDIGCVSSIDKIITSDGKVSGEGLYVKYEMAIRRLESKVNSLVGVSGSFFAVRKELCNPWPKDLASDFNVVFNVIRAGKKAILDEKAVGFYKDVLDEKKEFERKVRTIIRGITVLSRNLDMLNPLKYGLFSWQLFSHKVLRWISPFLLILLFLCNLYLRCENSLFYTILIFQVIFYIILFIVNIIPVQYISFLYYLKKISNYFIGVNLSIIIAWWRFIKGERISMWQPSQRV